MTSSLKIFNISVLFLFFSFLNGIASQLNDDDMPSPILHQGIPEDVFGLETLPAHFENECSNTETPTERTPKKRKLSDHNENTLIQSDRPPLNINLNNVYSGEEIAKMDGCLDGFGNMDVERYGGLFPDPEFPVRNPKFPGMIIPRPGEEHLKKIHENSKTSIIHNEDVMRHIFKKCDLNTQISLLCTRPFHEAIMNNAQTRQEHFINREYNKLRSSTDRESYFMGATEPAPQGIPHLFRQGVIRKIILSEINEQVITDSPFRIKSRLKILPNIGFSYSDSLIGGDDLITSLCMFEKNMELAEVLNRFPNLLVLEEATLTPQERNDAEIKKTCIEKLRGSKLISLGWDNISLTDDDIKIVGAMIPDHPTLRDLFIREVELPPIRLSPILQSLKNSHGIQLIQFDGTSLTPQEVKLLSEALYHGTSIHSIYLFSCAIDDEGAQYLGEALKNDLKLSKLDLTNNGITHVGAKSILRNIISRNSKVKTLVLEGNPIGDRGFVLFKLAKFLPKSYLGRIFIEDTEISKKNLLRLTLTKNPENCQIIYDRDSYN